jgi:hypothetical protein
MLIASQLSRSGRLIRRYYFFFFGFFFSFRMPMPLATCSPPFPPRGSSTSVIMEQAFRESKQNGAPGTLAVRNLLWYHADSA